MTSIVKDRPSDIIFDLLNYLNTGKETGALKGNELSTILELTGDLTANQIRRGLLTEEQVDQIETLLPADDKYFRYSHNDISRARKMFQEGDDIALEEANKRNIQAKPLFSEDSYTSFRKL